MGDAVVPVVVKRVGIIGSGIMGAGLAEVAARAGCEVTVRSRTQTAVDEMMSRLAAGLDRQVAKGRLEPGERDEVIGRIRPTDHLGALVDADLVIESVVEDLDIKKALFRELEQIVHPEAILATNTSTFPVVELAAQTERADKVCGLHFFNPAPVMPLVEIVRPITASDETIATVRAFALACQKEPVVVADRAGFVVNALLFPYLNNAVRLHERGTATMEDIDTAMRGGCNFPMGPFALLDLVGIDTSVAILEALFDEYRDPSYAPVPTLRRMVAAGHLGRKTKRGFYDYGC
jgi:3-hydroxybutyryl-CoA dehydrogenase